MDGQRYQQGRRLQFLAMTVECACHCEAWSQAVAIYRSSASTAHTNAQKIAGIIFNTRKREGDVVVVVLWWWGMHYLEQALLAVLPRVRLRTALPKARHCEGVSPWQSLVAPARHSER